MSNSIPIPWFLTIGEQGRNLFRTLDCWYNRINNLSFDTFYAPNANVNYSRSSPQSASHNHSQQQENANTFLNPMLEGDWDDSVDEFANSPFDNAQRFSKYGTSIRYACNRGSPFSAPFAAIQRQQCIDARYYCQGCTPANITLYVVFVATYIVFMALFIDYYINDAYNPCNAAIIQRILSFTTGLAPFAVAATQTNNFNNLALNNAATLPGIGTVNPAEVVTRLAQQAATSSSPNVVKTVRSPADYIDYIAKGSSINEDTFDYAYARSNSVGYAPFLSSVWNTVFATNTATTTKIIDDDFAYTAQQQQVNVQKSLQQRLINNDDDGSRFVTYCSMLKDQILGGNDQCDNSWSVPSQQQIAKNPNAANFRYLGCGAVCRRPLPNDVRIRGLSTSISYSHGVCTCTIQ